MSIDMYFGSCNISGATSERVNPFTGEIVQIAAEGICTDSERAAVKALLVAASGNTISGGHGVISFADGNGAECSFDGLEEDSQFGGGSLHFQRVTPGLAEFMYDLAVCGNFYIAGTSTEDAVIVTSKEATGNIPKSFPGAVVVNSGKELHDRLAGELKDAEVYLRRAVEDADD